MQHLSEHSNPFKFSFSSFFQHPGHLWGYKNTWKSLSWLLLHIDPCLGQAVKKSECAWGVERLKEIESGEQFQVIKCFCFPTQNSKGMPIQLPCPLVQIPSPSGTEEVRVPVSSGKVWRKESEWFWSHRKLRLHLLSIREQKFLRYTANAF